MRDFVRDCHGTSQLLKILTTLDPEYPVYVFRNYRNCGYLGHHLAGVDLVRGEASSQFGAGRRPTASWCHFLDLWLLQDDTSLICTGLRRPPMSVLPRNCSRASPVAFQILVVFHPLCKGWLGIEEQYIFAEFRCHAGEMVFR